MDHVINLSKNDPLAGSSYIKLPKWLNNQRKVWTTFKILMIKSTLNGV